MQTQIPPAKQSENSQVDIYIIYPRVQYCNKYKTHKYLHTWIRSCTTN